MDFSVPKNEPKGWELDVLAMSGADLAKYEIVDIREPEQAGSHILASLLRRDVIEIPLTELDQSNPPLQTGKQYLFICHDGAISSKLVAELRQRGFNNVYCLEGGYESVRRKYIA